MTVLARLVALPEVARRRRPAVSFPASAMSPTPLTRPSLILRIREARDGEAWEEFARIYEPLIRGFCRRRGLQEADAADVTQDSLLALSRAVRGFDYDPGAGTFRGWLFTVVRSKLCDHLAARARGPQGTGRTSLHVLLEERGGAGLEEAWERECREHLLRWAAERVRPEFRESSWEAFRRTAVLGEDAGEAARALGMSVGAVYIAKSRVLSRLRELIGEVSPGLIAPRASPEGER